MSHKPGPDYGHNLREGYIYIYVYFYSGLFIRNIIFFFFLDPKRWWKRVQTKRRFSAQINMFLCRKGTTRGLFDSRSGPSVPVSPTVLGSPPEQPRGRGQDPDREKGTYFSGTYFRRSKGGG